MNRLQNFLKLEASAGIILMMAALLALIANNSALSDFYGSLLSTPMKIQVGELIIAKPLTLWINDGLMAIFFFLVGLEVKREVLAGELSTLNKASLPIFGAIGGMLIPALIYAAINWNSPDTINGWAIPAATDIAFALGILMLLGTRAPLSLKILLLAIAIIDDLGAILIIALFYTADLSVGALALASLGVAALFGLNRAGVKQLTPYALVGLFMWVCVLKSGVHATMAGVITALFIPMTPAKEGDKPLLHRVEHDLHPWVAFLVLPIFAFANAGMSFADISLADFANPLPLGVALGLVFGKPIGVFFFCYFGVKLGLAKLPADINWGHIFGLSCLTGVGFTMSLFIGGLAFDNPDVINMVRLGVITGSVVSGIAGYTLLRMLVRNGAPKTEAFTTNTQPQTAN